MSIIKRFLPALRSVDMFNNINIDRSLGFTILSLLILGTVMVYSARLPLPSDSDLSFKLYNLGMHPVHVLLGLLVMFIFLQIPTKTVGNI